MFVATLIGTPNHYSIDTQLLQSLRNAWGGGDAVWLAAQDAAEFRILKPPLNFKEVRFDLNKHGIDLCLQPAENRKKKLLVADMDSTMIQQECIDELAAEAGVGDKVAEITARAMNGELEFESALKERVSLLKGLSTDIIEKVWNERITVMPGGTTLLATMKENGAKAALVSGGFTDFTEKVSKTLGFDFHRANVLLSQDQKLTGLVGEPILGKDAKVAALKEHTAQMGISLDDAIAVGDGANDLGMLLIAGTGVALHAKPAVQAQANHSVNHGDLTALLYLQGYAKSEFVQFS